MAECKELRERLDAMLAQKAGDDTCSQEVLEKEMAAQGERERKFVSLASCVYAKIIEPRLIVIQDCYDDAMYHAADLSNAGIVDFNKSRRYSATVQLYMAVISDPKFETLVIQYRFQILPIFMQFQSDDVLRFPLDDVDELLVTKFVDDKILQSIETYLRMQEVPQYLQDNMVTDPVCGMRISRVNAISCEQNGTPYFFCAKICRDRFLAEPNRFLRESKTSA